MEIEQLPKEEAVRRLRTLGQPATLFGEDEADRLRRLHVVQSKINVEDEHQTGGQQANERRDTEARAVEEYAQKAAAEKARAAEAAARKAAADRGRDIGTGGAGPAAAAGADGAGTRDDDDEETKGLQDAFAAAAKSLQKKRSVETMKPVDQVGAFFKSLLEEWEKELDSKGEDWIYSDLGRQTIANCRLCRLHMKPLFKRVKRRELPGDIERGLFLIVQAMRARNYRQAADVYVGLAIGNAPWPIGVTSIGIHERSAREKIGAQSQAHAMHDEETRKYLQSVKRLITFAQRIYPTVPSLSLDFNSGFNGWDKDSLLKEDAKLDIRQQVPALLALPTTGRNPDGSANGEGKLADGWKAQDGDTRTWKSILTHAYKGVEGEEEIADMSKITTAKDQMLAKDKTMYDNRSGHLTRHQNGRARGGGGQKK